MKVDSVKIDMKEKKIDKRLENALKKITDGNYRAGSMRPYPGQTEYVPTYVSAGITNK